MYITYLLEGVPINFVTVLANAHNYSKMPPKKQKNTNEQTPYGKGVESDEDELPIQRTRRAAKKKVLPR